MPVSESKTAALGTSAEVARRPGSPWIDAGIVLALVAGVMALDVAVTGWVPTGADSGNWLAMARELLGEHVMSANVSYPPVIPALLAGFLTFSEPIFAVALLDILTRLALIGAVYLCVRPLGRGYATGAALVVALAGAQVEAYAWGAFPQQLATALALTSLVFMIRFLQSRQKSHLWWALTLAILTSLTHLLIAGLLAVAAIVAWAHWNFASRFPFSKWFPSLWVPTTISASALLYPLAQLTLGPTQAPVLNPQLVDRVEALNITVHEALPLWVLVCVFALITAMARRWPPAALPSVSVGLALVLVGSAFFLVVGERRALLFAQIGFVLIAAAGMSRLARRTGRHTSAGISNTQTARWRYAAVFIPTIAVIGGLVAAGISTYPVTADYYRVVDDPELAILDHLADLEPRLALASRGNNGIQIGWWIEGYAGVPTYSGMDPQYLAFYDEREQAAFANSIFSGEMSVESARKLGIEFIVADRRGPDADWLDSVDARSLSIEEDSQTLVVLRVHD